MIISSWIYSIIKRCLPGGGSVVAVIKGGSVDVAVTPVGLILALELEEEDCSRVGLVVVTVSVLEGDTVLLLDCEKEGVSNWERIEEELEVITTEEEDTGITVGVGVIAVN